MTDTFDPDKPDEQMLYTTGAVAKLFGVTAETVRDWIAAKKLKAVRLGGSGRFRVRRADLVAFANHEFGSEDLAG